MNPPVVRTVPPEQVLTGEGLAMLAQAMLALRSTADLGTASAIAG